MCSPFHSATNSNEPFGAINVRRARMGIALAILTLGMLVALCGCRDNKLLDVAIGDENRGDNRSDTATTTTNNDSNNEVAE